MVDEKEKMARATVAQGHTIEAPVEAKKKIAGYEPGANGTPGVGPARMVSETRSYGPGEEIMLPESEVVRLRQTGHLVDPEQKAPNYGPGPSFNRDVAPGARAA